MRDVRRIGGGRGLCGGGRKKSGWGVSWTTSELSALTLTSERLQPGMRGTGAERGECMGCFLDNLRAFGINADHWTTAA